MPRVYSGHRLGRRGHIGGQADDPSKFGAALVLWLVADRGQTLDGSNNLLTWRDQSRNQVLYTGQAANYSVWTAGVLNGKPGIQHGTAASLMTSGAFTLAPPYTCISVMKSAAAVGVNIFGPYDGTLVAHGLAHTGVGSFNTIQSVGWTSSSLVIADGTEAAGCVFRASTDATASMNAISVASGVGSFGTFTFANGTSDICRPVIGTTYSLEHMLFNKVIDPGLLRNYIANRYALTLT